jgi:ribosome biogenesis GTPase / thiamine phosphate phosphatase
VSVLVDGVEVELAVPLRLSGGPLVAGDRVSLGQNAAGVTVSEILPRRTLLSRGEPRRPTGRPIVANADLLVVVASTTEPPFRARLIDRYLVAGEAGDLDAAIVITKTDLPHDTDEIARATAIYTEVGYPVLAGSTDDPAFVARVRELVAGRVAALVGHSGVGKSSLTRAMTGVERAVGAVSEKVGKGRHTTSDPRLIPIPGGGALVDTAGVRTFHLPPINARTLAEGFPEILEASEKCRFRGCRHIGEAGCAVEEAVTAERLDSYRRMLAKLS